jgi:hypothetical protein
MLKIINALNTKQWPTDRELLQLLLLAMMIGDRSYNSLPLSVNVTASNVSHRFQAAA